VIALLLDLANIVGGFLLAIPLLQGLPRAGDDLARIDRSLAPFGWIVGIVALVAGGYYFILHATSGPHIFHFEVIGIGVGVALLWGRLTGRATPGTGSTPGTRAGTAGTGLGAARGTGPGSVPEGAALLLAVFGIIAIIVGVQGLFTPN
jgi:multisubunit Na+/H+ antiporter MnhC subunit